MNGTFHRSKGPRIAVASSLNMIEVVSSSVAQRELVCPLVLV